MPSTLKTLRQAADPVRARVLLLLDREELSVAELQRILGLGQSTLSTHLARLKQAGLVAARRTGQSVLYRLAPSASPALLAVLRPLTPEQAADRAGLRLALARRRDRVRAHFDELAGRFGRQYVPGRSWQGLSEALLELLPPLVIADLGAGEGNVAQLLARRARRVIAVDNSAKMVAYGAALARRHGVRNLQYRRGDLEQLPIADREIDVALLSQSLHHAPHPEKALAEARRVLKPGGRVVILDLLKHNWDKARALYADHWLGFTEAELERLLAQAGFRDARLAVVHREKKAPHFATLFAVATRPAASARA